MGSKFFSLDVLASSVVVVASLKNLSFSSVVFFTNTQNIYISLERGEQWKNLKYSSCDVWAKSQFYIFLYTCAQKWPDIEMRCIAISHKNIKRKEKSYFFENWEERVLIGEHECRELVFTVVVVTYIFYTRFCRWEVLEWKLKIFYNNFDLIS